jgi:hypothetical protein
MSNPTTPFSWQMPTATDLVTDLPADFEVFGQAVATSMADLLGGTSGQILAKNTNADMDFVWIANDQGDITAVTAGTGITGGGTSGAVTITNDMATTITTNGDLIYGTGSGTYTRRAIGSTNQVLTVSGGVPTWATPTAAAIATALATVATDQTTTSTSYADLATAGPAVTVTTGTKALVSIKASMANGAALTGQMMGVAVSGATTVAASDTYGAGYKYIGGPTNFQPVMAATFLITGLTAGSNTFTAKYRSVTGDTIYFKERMISVVDLGS